MTGERSAAVRVAFAAAIISSSAVFVKIVHVGPIVSGFYRVFFGGLILLALAGWKGERLWKDRRWFFEAVACSVFFVLDLLAWHQSILYIGPGLATILANFQVFCLALFGVAVLGERLTLRLALSIPLAVGGLFMLLGRRADTLSPHELTGIVLGLLAAVLYTGFLLTLRRLQSRENPLSAKANLSVVCLISSVIIGSYILWSGDSFIIPDRMSLVNLVAYAVFSQVIGWIIITGSLPAIRASLAGLLLLLQPSLAFLWDVLFFGKQTTWLNLVGAAVTLTAIYVGATRRAPPGGLPASPVRRPIDRGVRLAKELPHPHFTDCNRFIPTYTCGEAPGLC